MHAVRRKVFTYGGYAERWSDDYRLSIEYERPCEHYVNFIDGKWSPEESVDEAAELYLRSAAAVADALEKCVYFDMPIQKVYEFLPDREILPEELLRALLDEKGLEMEDALQILVRSFGEKLLTLPDRNGLSDIQPRTAALHAVLKTELQKSGIVYHDEYNDFYRSPVGAVTEGTEIRFRILAFGVESAEMLITADGFSAKIPMRREGDTFVCRFTPPRPAAYEYSFGGSAHRLTAYCRDFSTPEWFKRCVMYQIFPDRFGFCDDGTAEKGIEYHRSLGRTPQLHKSIDEPVKWQAREGEKEYSPDDFYGGSFKGIMQKLPYLKSLGIGVIYLNPIVEARSNHRYDTADYLRPDPILGSAEDYVNLCTEAAKISIRIIDDGVFSHTGADSRYFNKYNSYVNLGAFQSKDSEYYPWYSFRSFPEEYKSWWGFKELPEVNELDRRWQEFVVTGENSVVKHWLRLGAAGWRLDVADELPDEVLSLIRKSAKDEKPDALILGEVWEDAVTKESYGVKRNYALGYSLDSVMNYPFRTAVIDFALGRKNSYELRELLLEQKYNYPAPLYFSLMNLLGSHDVARLHTVLSLGTDFKGMSRAEQVDITISDEQKELGTARQKLCAAIQYCVPGVPCLYYGDEECLDGALDPFCRAPFEPRGCGLHNFYAKLGELRNGCEALISGDMELETPAPNIIIIYRMEKNEKIACVINNSPVSFAVPFDGTSLLNGYADGNVPPMSCEIYQFT